MTETCVPAASNQARHVIAASFVIACDGMQPAHGNTPTLLRLHYNLNTLSLSLSEENPAETLPSCPQALSPLADSEINLSHIL